MSDGLWQWEALVAAAHGRAEGEPGAPIAGLSIDSRTLAPDEVFVALTDARDGHLFVPAAFAAGAGAAIVAHGYSAPSGCGALLRVADPALALADIGLAARRRSNARIVAVTGSVGKTGTKEMLRLCLASIGKTHAAEKSFNNHWGVPLSLARMPPDSAYAVFEIGMNHPGEIAPLARMVQPQVAIITAVEAVHLGHFASVEDIARAKAEIFSGLPAGGLAVLPRASAHFELLRAAATDAGARVISFGEDARADVRAAEVELGPSGSVVTAACGARHLVYRLGVPGAHYVANSLAVLAVLEALGVDPAPCLASLASLRAPPGRGARTRLALPDGTLLLIDESYNASPASVRAALSAMAATPRSAYPRRIAVLGDMLELGAAAGELHRDLSQSLYAADVDLLLACGPLMRLLYDALPTARRGAWAASSHELLPELLSRVRGGDVVMVKGSLAMRMAPLVAAMLRHYGPGQPGG
jgi:UDP-N-acetylmuramoyl-tripeptide--D-alanyl-D-alanine ligase